LYGWVLRDLGSGAVYREVGSVIFLREGKKRGGEEEVWEKGSGVRREDQQMVP
jgi:hypothetical protein